MHKLRVVRKTGEVDVLLHGLRRSTVFRALRKLGIHRSPPLEPKPPVQRHERDNSGGMRAMDIRWPGKIAGVGGRTTGPRLVGRRKAGLSIPPYLRGWRCTAGRYREPRGWDCGICWRIPLVGCDMGETLLHLVKRVFTDHIPAPTHGSPLRRVVNPISSIKGQRRIIHQHMERKDSLSKQLKRVGICVCIYPLMERHQGFASVDVSTQFPASTYGAKLEASSFTPAGGTMCRHSSAKARPG